MSKLALFGGNKHISKPLKLYRTIGVEEEKIVQDVMKSGCLSGYVGAWCDEFNGGPYVQEFEKQWSKKFNIKHSVAVNSNTSGLIAALGAIGLSPGDEVIVPAWSMSATSTAPIFYGGVPIFVDIEENTFCLNVELVEEAITPKTKAIIAVNLFGHPAELRRLKVLADKMNIFLIEDNAQAPLAKEFGNYTGTIGHVGVFSLNYHKHIHTGEGGVCVTNDDELAIRMQGIRNHGENIVESLNLNPVNMIGFNFRMTELSAAIGIEQLKKIDNFVNSRIQISKEISMFIKDNIEFIQPPITRQNCEHVYYLWGGKFNTEIAHTSLEIFSKALHAEGCPNSFGYVKPLYNLPMFQRKIGLGRNGFPFNLSNIDYSQVKCPVAEKLFNEELFELFVCSYDLNEKDLDLMLGSILKVYENIHELKNID